MSFMKPKIPSPPPPPPPPPPVPTEVAQPERVAFEKESSRRKGRRSTLLSGALGDGRYGGAPTSGGKTLLG